MGVGDDVEVAGRQRRRQVHGRALVVRADAAAATAGRGPETSRPQAHRITDDFLCPGVSWKKFGREVVGIEALRQHRAMDRDDRDAESLAVFLRQQFTRTALGRRLQHAVG